MSRASAHDRPAPLLLSTAVYIAHDRNVCANVCCAGATALYTGVTIGGAALSRVTSADVREWASYDLGPLRCECGAVTLAASAGPDGWPVLDA